MEGVGKLTCEQFYSKALCVIFLRRPRVFFNTYGLNLLWNKLDWALVSLM